MIISKRTRYLPPWYGGCYKNRNSVNLPEPLWLLEAQMIRIASGMTWIFKALSNCITVRCTDLP